jgi:hypothetical protein
MTPKRPGMSDAARANVGRQARRTPRDGVRIPESWDDELTPPPQEILLPSERSDSDSIPPPIRDRFDELAANYNDLSRAIGKVWDSRKDGDRLEQIDSKLGTLASFASRHEALLTEMIVPGFKECAKATDVLARQLPQTIASIEALTITLGLLDRRLRDLEVEARASHERWTGLHDAHAKRLSDVEAARDDLRRRLDVLETDRIQRETTALVHQKQDRRSNGAVGAGAGAVVAGIVSAIVQAIT